MSSTDEQLMSDLAGRSCVVGPARRRGRATELGQTLPLIVFFMFSLIGVSGLAIDVGSWYQSKHSLQAAADAAALAGASQIPSSWSNASAAAASQFAKNILLIPYRLIRRGQRKRRLDEARHRELMGAVRDPSGADR